MLLYKQYLCTSYFLLFTVFVLDTYWFLSLLREAVRRQLNGILDTCETISVVVIVQMKRSPPITRHMSASSKTNKQQNFGNDQEDSIDSVFHNSDFAQLYKLYNEIRQLCVDTNSKVDDLQIVKEFDGFKCKFKGDII